jgi:hypothetical protein
VGKKASKNGSSIGADRDCYRSRHTNPDKPGQGQGAGKDLVEKFLAELDCSWQEHPEIFDTVMIMQPRLYFRTLVKLAQVQGRGPSELSDLDRQRIRTEALLRLQRL